MTVRRFLIAYLGTVAIIGASGAATVHVLRQRHAADIAVIRPQPIAPAQPQQMAAAVEPSPQPLPAPPVVRPAVPPLAQHHAPPPHAVAHASKPGNGNHLARAASKPHPPTLVARSAPHQYPPPGAESGPPEEPYYGPGPYAAAWPPGPGMPPRWMRRYANYPNYPYYYGYYPPPPYRPAF